MSKALVENHRDANIAITVVWTDRWPMDGTTMAQKSAGLIDPTDARVQHFHESDRSVGKAVARALGWPDPEADDNAAWDIYLFWPAGVRWDDAMPAPQIVVHQLGAHADEPEFRTGDRLVSALDEGVVTITAAPRS